MGVGYLTGQGGGGSNIKSIQTLFAYDYSAAGSSVNYTINAVDISKSIVLIDTKAYQGDYGITTDKMLATVKLTSPTNVLMQVGGSSITHSHVITVVEFNNVKTKQVGYTVTPNNGVNIPNVNLSKSLLFFSYRRTNAFTGPHYFKAIGYFQSSVQIFFSVENPSDTTLEWQVIEFK